MNLSNPYKLQHVPLREVRFDVGEEDFARLFACAPRRGVMDAILSNLFRSLAAEVTRSIPLPTEAAEFSPNEQQLALLLSRISFSAPL